MLSLLTLLTMLKQWHIHLDTLLYGRGTMEIGHGYMVLSPSEKKWTRLDTPLTAMTTIAPMLLKAVTDSLWITLFTSLYNENYTIVCSLGNAITL